MKGLKRCALPVLIASLVLAVSSAQADVTRTDMQVAARALSFISNPLTGPVKVGILYSKSSSRSVRQAENLRAMLADGLRVGSLQMSPVLVELREAADADVDLFFLTEHIEPNATDTLADNTSAPILCVTTDIDQVRNGACTIGVRSRPKVEVFVSMAAAKASDITFSTVFRVMITEL